VEFREPHPSLRGDFERYVGFEDFSGVPRSWLEVPFAGAALIISLDTRWRMNGAFERGSFIAGVHDESTVVEHDGFACCLEIHFTPLGARRFQQETGTTPYRWILRQRVLLAQRLLEATDETVDAIAGRAGFGNAAALRHQFMQAVGTTPNAYRRTFRGPEAAA